MHTKIKLYIIFIFLLSGCASGSINIKEPVSTKLSNYSTLLVDVSFNNTEYFSEAKNQLETLLISELRKNNFFEKVISTTSSASATADLQLSITIIDLYKVTRSNRLFWGYIIGGCFGGPGSAKIRVTVNLFEPGTKKIISEFEVVGRSSRHSTFAGTTKQAIKVAVNQIVENIRPNL